MEATKYPSMDAWIKKNVVYTQQGYSTIKKNETWTLATTWMDLKGLCLVKEVRKRKMKKKYEINK